MAKLNKRVTYTDRNGFQKAALVVGTRDSIQKGTDLERPDKGCAHLKVFSPAGGGDYYRPNVPEGDGPGTFTVA